MLKRIYMTASLLALSGCIYSNVQAPLDVDVSNSELGTKVGKSHSYSILWLVAWGDAGTKAAAADGDIKVVRHLDGAYFSVLFGAYTKVTTIAYGD